MTSGLVNASFSLPEWQAVKMIFFAPWFLKHLKIFKGEELNIAIYTSTKLGKDTVIDLKIQWMQHRQTSIGTAPMAITMTYPQPIVI